MRGEVVQDDNGARFELWYQHLLDVGLKGFAIHCALDDPRRNQRVGAEACDESLCTPRPEGRLHDQPLASLGPATLAGQVGFDRGFVNEDNLIRSGRDRWQSILEPFVALLSYPCAPSFGGDQCLFLYVKPSLRRKRPIASGCA